jgi:hypothetical protein
LLFSAMQRLRPSLVAFLDSQSRDGVGEGLGAILRVALRIPSLQVKEWVQRPWTAAAPPGGVAASSSSSSSSSSPRLATGRWDAVGAELTVDLQTTEVLWRNDELKPVPDSMVQFVDYAGED